MSEIQKARDWAKSYWAAHWPQIVRHAGVFALGLWAGTRFC